MSRLVVAHGLGKKSPSAPPIAMVQLGKSAKARRAPEKVYGRRTLSCASRKARRRRTGADGQTASVENAMRLRVGYELQYDFPQPTPVMLMLSIHYTRVSDLERPDHIVIAPSVPIAGYRDGFGNWCSRILAPAGDMRISTDTVIGDTRASRQHGAGCGTGSGAGPTGGGNRIPAREPVLRQRPAARCGMDPLWTHRARLGTRTGHLRFRACAHRLQLPARTAYAHSLGSL